MPELRCPTSTALGPGSELDVLVYGATASGVMAVIDLDTDALTRRLRARGQVLTVADAPSAG